MSFKNALKNLVAHFGVVWSLLLYIFLFAAVITGLSLPFILPLQRAFSSAGVFDDISGAFGALFNDGNFGGFYDGLSSAYVAAETLLTSDSTVASLSIWFLVLIAVFVFRFFLGLYEIPLATVMDGQMSCNSRYGFGGKFFSTLFMSVRYSFFKMIFTVVYDMAIFGILYAIRSAISFNIGLVFLSALILILLAALRFSVVACWAPAAIDRGSVLRGFVISAKICIKRFGSVLSSYFVSLILIVALSVFITIFTLGVGLIIVLPLCACYIMYLNMTVYYNKTGKRYYVDEAIFTPPTENVL